MKKYSAAGDFGPQNTSNPFIIETYIRRNGYKMALDGY